MIASSYLPGISPLEVLAGMIEAHLDGRCVICSWPLQRKIEDGCVVGNCSMRDENGRMAELMKRRHEVLRAIKEIIK